MILNNRFGVITDQEIIQQAKQQCIDKGMNPELLPTHTYRLNAEALAARRAKYNEYIEVIQVFVNKFLSSGSGNPVVITMTDNEGFILDMEGDPTIIETARYLGIMEGSGYSQEDGPSSIDLCLRYKRPFTLIGEDHFHHILHRMACYSAPFHGEDGKAIIGTISLMTNKEFVHPHLYALLCTMADSLEREMVTRKQNTQLQTLNQVLLGTKHYGVIITDAEGQILQMNETSLCLLCPDAGDRDRTKYVGRPVFGIKPIGEYYERVIYEQEICIGEELSLEISGSMHHYILDVQPVYDRERQLMRVVGSLRDITEMKRTEEVLRNTEKLVFAGQVAVSIAHEVRNPLTTVKGMLQLANKDAALRHYDLIMSELERANLMVGEFMILGKPQAAVFKLENCGEILEEVLHLFAIQASLGGIKMTQCFDRNATILCDRNQIKQVFLNILKNAMEALPFGGNIHIQMDVEDGYQRVTFTDNGSGMTEDVLRRIGEPFHTTKPDGNGLGIMIVHRIMESHNGRLVIRSEEERGTSVEIHLPISGQSLSN
ncbi:Signal transduction histidine kinase [Paenibacillus sp. cl141a]|uniref:ATP-binding protein n=1 Tax=Paenibacillus sp. cl141a TaxID=1761877 RepID=UPI0008BE3DAC|nr:ATP-binding protein [Paenibacillus sp. cl141a]SEL48586.1 Signal transduction histidine kinase [Paenibacillus sp. cl141a]